MLKTGFVLSLLAGIVIVIAAIMIISGPSGLPGIDSGIVMDQPKSLPDFELVTHQEKKLTRDDFRGQWSLLFTGFTSCPDICPATISILKTLENKLLVTGTDIEMYLLSVDPERDTPDIMNSYLGLFSQSLTGITGSLNEVGRFCDEIGLSFIHIPETEGRYSIEHSGALVLIDPRARVAAYFKPPFDTDQMARDLQFIANSGNL